MQCRLRSGLRSQRSLPSFGCLVSQSPFVRAFPIDIEYKVRLARHFTGTSTARLATSPLMAAETPRLKNVLAAKSRSPYVRAHATNPTAWQVWDADAIALAKKHDRLIFLSIGYAACHWCHVMERESFENDEVAQILNSSFIPIKLDKEERPDIDRIYMNYVQATTGHGGWPMSVFLTTDLDPVFGGTYFPGQGSSAVKAGHPGFVGVLERVKDLWMNQRQRCISSAGNVMSQLREFAQDGTLSGPKAAGEQPDILDIELLDETLSHFSSRYDAKYGGFGNAPKFPTPSNLAFLLLLAQYPQTVVDVVGHKECENAQLMALATLRSMTRGGIKDQIGNGFARYSVTKDWSLPHFEKMLYDNAQLLSVYVDAFLTNGDSEMLGSIYDIAKYLTNAPLASPHGPCYSSEDADSYARQGDAEKREGAFYVWTRKEIDQVLAQPSADVLCKFYGISEEGNVAREQDPHDELVQQNVLKISTTPDLLAAEFGLTKDECIKWLKEGRKTLQEHRNKVRPRPGLDDKIIVAWNGLAIGALARASSLLESVPGAELCSQTRDAAIKSVDFIKQNLFDAATQTMRRVYREGPGEAPAFADDYAFLIQGLIELYEATFDDQYLQFADQLQQTQIKLFWDEANHGFFSTQKDQADVVLRLKDGMDNAEPSTNGVSASNLYRLGSILEDGQYIDRGRKTCEAFSTELQQHPFVFTSMMQSIVAGRLGMRSMVICGSGKDVEDAIRKSRLKLKPNTTVARLGPGSKCEWLRSRNHLIAAMNPDKASVQVCEGGVCKEELGAAEVDSALQQRGDE